MDLASLALQAGALLAAAAVAYGVLRQRLIDTGERAKAAHDLATAAAKATAELREQVIRVQVAQEWLAKELREGLATVRTDLRRVEDKLDKLLDRLADDQPSGGRRS